MLYYSTHYYPAKRCYLKKLLGENFLVTCALIYSNSDPLKYSFQFGKFPNRVKCVYRYLNNVSWPYRLQFVDFSLVSIAQAVLLKSWIKCMVTLQLFYAYFKSFVFSTNKHYNFYNESMWKMTHPVLGTGIQTNNLQT